MKKMRYIPLLILAAFAFTFSGCKKLADVNVDPNQPAKVTTSLLLSAAESNYAYTQGGDLSRYTAVWTQQLTGADRQFVAVNDYAVTEVDMDNAWRFGLYGGAMKDLQLVISQAEGEGNPYYAGIGKTLMAYALMTCTDLFGDVPYAEAFKGSENLLPKYQTQQAIYTEVRNLTAAARADFAKAATDNAKLPGTDDFIYGGSIPKWNAFTYAIDARSWLHVRKQDPSAATKAITAVGEAQSAGFEDAAFNFSTSPTTANPWYQFSSQRSGYITFEGYLADQMTAMNDPRAGVYGDAMLETPSGPIGGTDAPVVLLSDAELDFIHAECALIEGDDAAAHTAYLSGIGKSHTFCGVSAPDQTAYVSQASVDPGSGNLALDHIMYEKYTAMYTQPEAFTDWRRTGLPALTPTTGSAIPRRFLYPQSEQLYNASNVPQGQSLFSRVWWDVQ
ncbi:MAG: SusD/RagB family nutrient-binding outer membrane lipoprotein [Bacteroidia bacterium]|nr:SusD/RagB family nutrient-binding outer membrane lipoprotein [Bacteroidia bacterium]